MEAFTLFEVNKHIRRVIALNFEEPIWVECEINQVSQSRGNTYLDLIEKEEDSELIIAKNSGTIWLRQMSYIKKKLGTVADSILSDGVKVKLKVQIDYKERFGLSLNVLDIDPAFTFGQYALQRQKTIDRLEQENLLEENSFLNLPSVIKNIAVISSETAAGYQDFLKHLNQNSYGYTFNTVLYKAAMQGVKTEKEVVTAINKATKEDFDIIAIIRGGGSRLDLSAFDHYNIAAAIAKAQIPVFTGIGHDIDMTVADMVSHSVLKTPTAVADFILEHNLRFESEVMQMYQTIAQQALSNLHNVKQELSILENKLIGIPSATIRIKELELNASLSAAFRAGNQLLKKRGEHLTAISQSINLLSPQNILKKGFTLVKQKEKYISKLAQLSKDKTNLEIEFFDGSIKVKVDKNES